MSQLPPPPPPPPGAPPPPPPATGGSFNVGDAMSYGWRGFWKNVGPLVALTIIIVLVHLALGAIPSNTSSVFGRLVIQLISFVVGIVLAMGLIRASLAVLDGRRPEVSMLFHTEGFGSYLIVLILVGVGVFVGLLLCIVPGIILGLMWELFVRVRHRREPDHWPHRRDARRSAEITKGYRWQLFGLMILLLLINLVGAILLGIGLLFTYGISAVALAYVYRVMSGQSGTCSVSAVRPNSLGAPARQSGVGAFVSRSRSRRRFNAPRPGLTTVPRGPATPSGRSSTGSSGAEQ